MKKIFYLLTLTLCMGMMSCDDDDVVSKSYPLSVSAEQVQLDASAAAKHVYARSTNGAVNATADADWLAVAIAKNGESAIVWDITLTPSENTAESPRTATVTVTDGTDTKTIAVTQAAPVGEVPDTPDTPVVDNVQTPAIEVTGKTATQLTSTWTAGINIGNTLEANGGETAWGAVPINQAYINGLATTGFTHVRIPCAWDQYADEQGNIDPKWLDRVHDVVCMTINAGMYAIINIHWDGGWLESSFTNGYSADIEARQYKLWSQIATRMADIDQRLVFGSANEPDVTTASQMETLNKYHAACIAAVRGQGADTNKDRIIIVQGPQTNIDRTVELMADNVVADQVADRLMVEVHYYDPFQFTLMDKDESWGKMWYFWGKDNWMDGSDRNSTSMDEEWAKGQMLKMKQNFVDKGYPVLIGEYCAQKHTELTGNQAAKHQASRVYWTKTINDAIYDNGLVGCLWDVSSPASVILRSNGNVNDPEILQVLTGYSK